jgi:hypothetical protein
MLGLLGRLPGVPVSVKLSVTNDSRRICTAVTLVVSVLVISALYHVLSVTL